MSQTNSHNTSSSLSSAGTVSSMETLPTQDVVDGDFDYHDEVEENPEIVWGRLLPVGKTFSAVDLKETRDQPKDEYIFGRDSSCDVAYSTQQMVNNPCFQAISKRHFRIYKEKKNSSVFVFIEDYSSNGTFLNGEKIGKGRKSPLKNNDEIALSLPKNKAYVFMDSSSDTEQEDLPEIMREKYIMSKVLGRGACGLVRLAFKKGSCEKFAIKIIEKKTFSIGGSMLSNMEKTVMEEVNILKALNHPCIIAIEDVCHTDDKLYIILELVEGGELFDRVISVKKFDELTAKVLFYQMLLATKYLHDNGITHRDLKPENILLNNDESHTLIKVTDFGLSKFLGEKSLMQTLCGTPTYLAPEVLTKAGKTGYGKSVDCWSLGVILFICLGGYPPFTEEVTAMPLDDQIKRGYYSFPAKFWKGVSDEAMDLIKKLLTVDAHRRFTVHSALDHPWLKDQKMKEIVENLMYPPSKKMPPPQIKIMSKKRPRDKNSDDINGENSSGSNDSSKICRLSDSSDDTTRSISDVSLN
ncbi:serine/threonine-protein kinase Chk2-like [Patiria miniata]|uniref:Serine/threonine-protein kinase Chk2 n=1 Tax=Patiria miniata TaxID=46514 RepID=A0A913ZRS8_PATMI|nr:serine/threonine-protein kinase Chk2-like [Patiria miniata]